MTAKAGAMADSFWERRRQRKQAISETNAKLDAVQRTLADAIKDFRPKRFTADDLEDEITGTRHPVFNDPGSHP